MRNKEFLNWSLAKRGKKAKNGFQTHYENARCSIYVSHNFKVSISPKSIMVAGCVWEGDWHAR